MEKLKFKEIKRTEFDLQTPKDEEIIKENCFVIYLDALGVSNSNNEELISFIKSFNFIIQMIKVDFWFEEDEIDFIYFQDSIIISIRLEFNDDNFFKIVQFISSIFVQGLYQKIYFRGVLNYGETIIYKNCIIGKPINEIIKIADRIQMLGIELTEEIITNFINSNLKSKWVLHKYSFPFFDFFNIPVKTKNNEIVKTDCCLLNWLPAVLFTYTEENNKFNYDLNSTKCKHLIIPENIKLLNSEIQQKYKNTKLFIELMVEKYSNFDRLNIQKVTP